ncbi:MAG: MT-A70 family methyltransferase, partial [Rhodospirillaceae bacterium]
GRHSAKPDEQYERIEALTGGPYLELFSRLSRPGWAAWGNQTGLRDGLFDGEAD